MRSLFKPRIQNFRPVGRGQPKVIKLFIVRRMILLAALPALFLSACDKVVDLNANKNESYIVKGDSHSELYPLDIKHDGEDVRIRLKKTAPIPEIVSVDPAGRSLPFNFSIDGNSLIVPGKFDHIVLRHDGAGSIDIFKVNAPR